MAITLVQSNTGNSTSSGATLGVAQTSAATSGNLILVAVTSSFTAFVDVSSITDTRGNTYTLVQNITGVSNANIRLYYAKNITGGTNTVTANFSGTGQAVSMIVREYSGLDTTAPLDKNAGTAGNSATPSSGATAATANASELVVGYGVNTVNASWTAGSGYGNGLSVSAGTQTSAFMEDKIVSSTGAQTADATLSQSWNWGMGVATFKDAGGAPATKAPPFPNRLSRNILVRR